MFTIISPRIITTGRYLNPEKVEELAFNSRQIERISRFYKRGGSRWRMHNERMLRFLEKGALEKSCTCGFNYLFIRHDGTLHLCPLVDFPIGNVTESKIEDLISSRRACDVRRHIGRFPDCSRCTEPGLERLSLPFEGWTYLKYLLKLEPGAFDRFHLHMGLDKFLS